MRILVTGANGQLGNEMQVLAKENPQHTYYFTDVQELDICDKQAVWAYIAEKRIELIVNCAAYTAVDKAEDNPELAYKLNCECLLTTCSTALPIFLIPKTATLVRIPYMALRNWKENMM